jgi:ribosome recycling factor
MNPILLTGKDEFQLVMEYLKKELSGIRTGRANSAVVENISVMAYGSQMPVKGVASIGVPDARTITVDPWDKSLIKEIEKGIRDAGVGLNPVNEGALLRISMPALTEESRRQLLKVVGEKTEEAREKIRGIREDVKSLIISAMNDNEVTEDERYHLQDELEAMVGGFNDQIKELADEKEKEMMTI